MPYAVNEGTRLYWEEHGKGSPVLMIMGLSFTHEMWYRVLPSVAEHFHVIVFDNRGMGRSDAPKGPYSIRQMARDAIAVMGAAELDWAHIIGASMGGMIAQELALRHPERVRSLLLACTSYSGLFSRWPDFSRRPRGISWKNASRREREQALVRLLYADTTSQERIEEDIRIRAQCCWNTKGFLNQFGAILMWSAYRRLPRIKAPTLVVHGDRDCLVPPANGRVVAERIPNARFQLIANAGHIITTDQPDQCCELMLDFLSEQEAVFQTARAPVY